MTRSLSNNRSSAAPPVPPACQRHASFMSTVCALLTVLIPAIALMWVVFPKDKPVETSQPCHWERESYTAKTGENLVARQDTGTHALPSVWQAWCPATCDATGEDTTMPTCAIPPLPIN